MGLPKTLRDGGAFVTGSLFEVFQKSEGYKDKEGVWQKSEHWVLDIKSSKVVRGKSRDISQFVYLSSDQVKRKVHEKFKELEDTFVCLAVFPSSFQRLMLDGDAPVNLSEVA